MFCGPPPACPSLSWLSWNYLLLARTLAVLSLGVFPVWRLTVVTELGGVSYLFFHQL